MTQLTIKSVRDFAVPRRSLTIWWLGQASFLIKSPAGKIVALDPYLSNSCKALGESAGFNMNRMVPPPLAPDQLTGIDLYLLTHSHQDHLDPETLAPYRAAGGKGPYLAPAETMLKLHEWGVPKSEVEMTWPNKVYSLGDLSIRATFAIPFGGDDLNHVGYLISCDGGPTVYFTGDTAYEAILASAVKPHAPQVMVAVINGAFRNISAAEAATLTREINPRIVIPCHHDLFPDNMQPPQMLRTNLRILGIEEKFRELRHGEPFTFSD